ncbi:hypothetical protein R1sor_026446 [Riccia sorocarpa]|uniref:Uncharacterized protein n=1 Tax=Riccia sorocarpa TaxID=122646 RepID=A0ABD3GBD9_9MARC
MEPTAAVTSPQCNRRLNKRLFCAALFHKVGKQQKAQIQPEHPFRLTIGWDSAEPSSIDPSQERQSDIKMLKLGKTFVALFLFQSMALQVTDAVDFMFDRHLNCLGDVVGSYQDVLKDTCTSCQ